MTTLLKEQFNKILITDEHAFYNPSLTDIVKSPIWDVTSGALYVKNSRAWTDSPIFRVITKRKDFKDVTVTFKLEINKFFSTAKTPAVDWDGVHIFLRYQSEHHLYVATVARRDGKIVIKKKVPGGSSNSGTYHDLSSYADKPFPLDNIEKVSATIRNIDGTVRIVLIVNGIVALDAIDNGTKGGSPIMNEGAVGIRGDNTEHYFDDFIVETV